MMNSSRPAVTVPERFNAATFFVDRNVAEGRGTRTAVLSGDERVTYDEVLERVNRTGNLLRSLGVEMENRVALALLDGPAFPYAFFGAIKIGAVPVPVNTLLAIDEFTFILEDSRSKVLFIHASLWEKLGPTLASPTFLKHVVVVEDRPPLGTAAIEADLGSAGRIKVHDFDVLLQDQRADLDPAPTHRDDVAFWLYTSGTTGSPSAAVHLQHDMVHCLELYAKGILGMHENDRTFSIAKLFFAYGLGNSLYCPFGVGATTILFPGRPTPEAVSAVVSAQLPTLFFGVPTSYAALLEEIENGLPWPRGTMRLAVSAGEPLSAHLYHRWLETTGVHILDGIGTTEVLHIFISNRPGDVRPGSTGKVVPGYEVKLVDDEGAPVPTGEMGNLMVRGDSTCSGYWNKHDVTRLAIEGEWIKTRDKYHVDEDGYLWYDGRTNDMLKVGGRWVSPAEVEAATSSHPAVLECAVVGVHDEHLLETPKAFVVLHHHVDRTADLAREIQAFVKERIAPYKYPREIEFIDELPKTATGKIQRYRLRQSA